MNGIYILYKDGGRPIAAFISMAKAEQYITGHNLKKLDDNTTVYTDLEGDIYGLVYLEVRE